MIYNDNAGDEFLESLRKGTFRKGLKIDCILDDYLRFKKMNFNVIAGHANVGKTLVVLYYFVCLAIKHDLKFAVFSSENEIGSLKDDLISLYSGRRISEMSFNELQYFHGWVNDHFKFFDVDTFFTDNKRLMNFRDVLITANDLPQTHNFTFDALVIDPYNSLGKAPNITGTTHEYDYAVTSELRMWCKAERKALYLLAHGNTEALRKVFAKEHRFAGHPIPLLSADIEGGGKFVNRCDDFIVVHRMTQNHIEKNRTELHITKVKNVKTGGSPTFKESPVIFEAQAGLLDFEVYLRNSEHLTPEETVIYCEPKNPLKDHRDKTLGENHKDKQRQGVIPNLDFENEKPW